MIHVYAPCDTNARIQLEIVYRQIELIMDGKPLL